MCVCKQIKTELNCVVWRREKNQRVQEVRLTNFLDSLILFHSILFYILSSALQNKYIYLMENPE